MCLTQLQRSNTRHLLYIGATGDEVYVFNTTFFLLCAALGVSSMQISPPLTCCVKSCISHKAAESQGMCYIRLRQHMHCDS